MYDQPDKPSSSRVQYTLGWDAGMKSGFDKGLREGMKGAAQQLILLCAGTFIFGVGIGATSVKLLGVA